MPRTQIYLTEDEQTAIRQISIRTGHTQSALIREAINIYIHENQPAAKQGKRMAAFALWKDLEEDPLDLAQLRNGERL